MVRMEDGGPAIFKQERVGRYGRTFNIYKFRSMRLDAEKNANLEYTDRHAIISAEGINISDLVNRSRGDHAYTMLDLDTPTSHAVVEDIKRINGVIRVRVIK
mgnify:CR=1 FL=1